MYGDAMVLRPSVGPHTRNHRRLDTTRHDTTRHDTLDTP
jgi:hypothetical protein